MSNRIFDAKIDQVINKQIEDEIIRESSNSIISARP